MKIIVLGAGVIGVSTAYYLAKAGHEVKVIDRQSGPALETSYANAGEISPGYASPWAGPGVPLKALKWITMQHGPLAIRPSLDKKMWAWVWQMLGNCNTKSYAINKSRMLRLAQYSREVLEQLRRDTNITYDERTQGTMQLFRTQKQWDGAQNDIAILKELGIAYELLDGDQCRHAEPALHKVRHKYVGALRLPHDETGDCFIFTQKLEAMAKAFGVEFEYGNRIHHLNTEANRIVGVQTATGYQTADAYVMALGSYSPQLLEKIAVAIPVYPIKGYSITVPVAKESAAPQSTILDETYKIAITRLGSRIRVGGTAEIAGYDLTLRDERRQTLIHSMTDLFPEGGDMSQIEFWAGLRPMTPDGTPIVGPTQYDNLFLNTGHGTLGWTMACGSGQLLSDLISQKNPAIDTEGLFIHRYQK